MYLFKYFDETSSTMHSIKAEKIPAIHIANTQTHGHGQYGRTWSSLPGQGIYFSLKNKVVLNNDEYILGLAQLAAIALAKTLLVIDVPVKLKWPNDLYMLGQKLGGVIVELVSYQKGVCDYIIGVGLNLKKPKEIENAIGLDAVCASLPDRDAVVADFVKFWDEGLQSYAASGLTTFKSFWQKNDLLSSKTVHLQESDHLFVGQSAGIDEHGGLMLKLNDGRQLSFNHQASIIDFRD